MHSLDDGIYAALMRRGISRRSFIKFSGVMAATLALPAAYGPRIAAAVEAAPAVPLVWLRGQACGGDSQAFVHSANPTVQDALLDLLTVDSVKALRPIPGDAAVASAVLVGAAPPVGYIAIVEGSIPSGADGAYCLIGGRAFVDVAREVCSGAIATIAVGSCAVDGGLSAASGGTTASAGAAGVAPPGTLICLPGCPVNTDNLAATVVHYLTFGAMPPVDRHGRPLFAYGGLIHNQCERRAHFEFGEFVLSWGDEAAQKGWCLYKMGCKGPETFANCPTVGYADGTSWPVQAGHGCIGCTMPGFWDGMGPAYSRLPPPLPFAPNITADQVGQAALAGVAAVTVVHGAASWVRGRRHHEGERTVQSVRPDTAAVQDPDRPAPPDAPEAERPDPETPPDTSEAERPDPETPPDAPEAERPDPETPPDAPESGRADPETPTTEAGVAEAVLAREPTPDEAFTEPDAGATGEPAADVG